MTVEITYGKGEIMIHRHLSIQEAREMGEKDKEEFVRAIEGSAHDSEVLYSHEQIYLDSANLSGLCTILSSRLLTGS